MKLVRVDQDRFYFELTQEEQIYLFHLLYQYPLVPAGYQSITRQRETKELAENQQLLDETLQARRLANRKQIIDMLNQGGRFVAGPDEAVVSTSFTRGEIEWLLQICNDIRIGSWLALGSPDLDDKSELRQEQGTARYFINMQIAGAFEMLFIRALDGDLGSDNETTDLIG
jgi:hypothetical protein